MSAEPLPLPFDEFLEDPAGTIDRVARDNAPVVVEHNGNRVVWCPRSRGGGNPA